MAEITRWVWEAGTQRYRNLVTGRFISSAEVVNLVNGIVDQVTDNPVATLNTMLADRRLNAADWKTGFARQIKNAYIQQAELAAGGRSQMTPQLWGMVGGSVREQYGYLDDFARQVANGNLTPAQIEARTKMYINSSREAYWRVKDAKAREQGFTEERWIAIGDDSTCSPCSDADAMGWRPIGTFAQPGSGRVLNSPQTNCQGLTNCRCNKEYRQGGVATDEEIPARPSIAEQIEGAIPATEIVNDAPEILQYILDNAVYVPSSYGENAGTIAGTTAVRQSDGSWVIRVSNRRKPSRDIIIHEATHGHQSLLSIDVRDDLENQFAELAKLDNETARSPLWGEDMLWQGGEVWAHAAGWHYGGKGRFMVDEASPRVIELLRRIYETVS